VEDASASDILVFGVVVALRLLVPLAIPRYRVLSVPSSWTPSTKRFFNDSPI
jgi:hypothetical protein